MMGPSIGTSGTTTSRKKRRPASHSTATAIFLRGSATTRRSRSARWKTGVQAPDAESGWKQHATIDSRRLAHDTVPVGVARRRPVNAVHVGWSASAVDCCPRASSRAPRRYRRRGDSAAISRASRQTADGLRTCRIRRDRRKSTSRRFLMAKSPDKSHARVVRAPCGRRPDRTCSIEARIRRDPARSCVSRSMPTEVPAHQPWC